MTGAKEQMQRIRDMRAEKAARKAELERELQEVTIELGILDRILKDEDGVPAEGRRRHTKKTILDIITEADKAGVTPNEVEQRAAARGRPLLKSTVQSTLSKEKAHGTLHFDGERYYVAGKEPAPKVPLQVVGSK